MGTELNRRMPRQNQRCRAIAPTKYAYDPYSALLPFQVISEGPVSIQTRNREVAKTKFLPKGTLHIGLFGSVPFIQYPEHVLDRARQRTEAPPLQDRPDSLVQLFFGQLPYKVADNMILFLCEQLAESDVLYIERVLQDKSRKGCMQVFVDEDDADYIISALNRRIVFDTTGVWQAQNDEQVRVLEKHLSSDTNRYKGFPFRVMVVERSTSTYVRRHKTSTKAQRSRSTTPPRQAATDADAEHASPPPEYEVACCQNVNASIDQLTVCQCACCSGSGVDEAPYSSYTAGAAAPPPYSLIQAEYEFGNDVPCLDIGAPEYNNCSAFPPPYYGSYQAAPAFESCTEYLYDAPPPPYW